MSIPDAHAIRFQSLTDCEEILRGYRDRLSNADVAQAEAMLERARAIDASPVPEDDLDVADEIQDVVEIFVHAAAAILTIGIDRLNEAAASVTLLAAPTGRACYYLSEGMTRPGDDGTPHYFPSIVEENVAGHSPTDYDFGTDIKTAMDAVADLNRKRNLSDDDVMAIVTSSFRAQQVNA